ncbi:MBL fold metallo-hydrolase [Carboxylicivirga sp. M1479]|uniref:MBL fold metallo-hydrolase n=1 Tax=Carboxylicivirga sp. M1479 TaxID=2594476 RepID=UPI001178615C|nr:MBL fold metallo-hydrolase [Carboxylicivirga sp. M1479]TRX66402.1 hypothetical protein FNN09_13630 [Carboxylicivirga sp. M1479]
MKQVIFNVGGALSVYSEFSGKKLLVDIGKSKDYNPITDFLLPLYERQRYTKSTTDSSKYYIDQLLISHPHNDHISAISDFRDAFFPELLTCPNDNDGMDDNHKVNWDLFDENPNIDILKEMLVGRQPPLRATHDQNEFIYYLPAKDVDGSDELSGESYCNNISIAVFLLINHQRIFMPGDIQKMGMKELIDRNYYLKNKLAGGVDFLITPHHGLKSSFSTVLFDNMRNKKTNRLNIVSEKSSGDDDNRTVDTRYSSSDYCLGNNNLSTRDSQCNQVKTSRGHILIDYSTYGRPKLEIISDKEILLEKFMQI